MAIGMHCVESYFHFWNVFFSSSSVYIIFYFIYFLLLGIYFIYISNAIPKVPYTLTSTLLELLSLAAYVSKDGLVGHHWKERPIGQANFICPSTGERQGQKGGVGG